MSVPLSFPTPPSKTIHLMCALMRTFRSTNMLISYASRALSVLIGRDPSLTLFYCPPVPGKTSPASVCREKFEKLLSGSPPEYNPINGTTMLMQHAVYGIDI
eukprot:6508907-Karenia_brevis.AAC.1